MEIQTNPAPHSAPVSRTFFLCVIVVGLLAGNLFVLHPWLARENLQQVGFFLYIGIRVVGFVALGYLLVRWAGRNRFQTVSTVMLVGAIDQVLLKFIATKQAMTADPSVFGPEGVPPDSAIFFGLATGFFFFAPILLILGFLGAELNRLGRDWKRSRPIP